jgi:glycosyltransferase involved in cell wall biosynthesis
MKPKLAILQYHPAPYRDPIFRKVWERSRIDITVLTMSGIDFGHAYRPQYAIDYPNHFLGKSFRFRYLGFFHPGIFKEIFQGNYDVYLTHIGSLTGIIVLFYSWMRKKPLILASDSVLFPRLNKIFFPKIRHWITSQVFKTFDTVWVPGNANQEFIDSHGFPNENIFQGAYCLDVDLILQLFASAKPKRQNIRGRLGVDDSDWLFLFVGRMLAFRGVKYLIEAFYLLKQRVNNAKLLIIGDGPEGPGLKAECQRLGLSDIIFVDPVPMDQLADYYVAADTYVTAALRENYSLALAQAAICGLPMISTNRVGAVSDYLVEGETGFLVPPGNSQALADAMVRLVASRNLAKAMGEKAAVLSKHRTVTWAAEQLEAAVLRAVDLSRR